MNLVRAVQVLSDAGVAFVNNGTVFTLVTDSGVGDLLAKVAGVGAYEEAFEHSVLVHSFDREVRTLDLKSLIRSKRAAGRPKDLALLPELEALLAATEV